MTFAEMLDHFVVPVDDLVAAEEFYSTVFGGEIVRRNGLNVRHRQRGAVPHTFIKIGGKRIGVYLQAEGRPKAASSRGLPTYSFTTTSEGMEKVIKALRELACPFEGPVKNSHSFASRSLFFVDPAGNHYAVYIPHTSNFDPGADSGPMTGVGYLELEAPRLEESVRFYEQVLGFELKNYGEDVTSRSRQATMVMKSGQNLILTEAAFKPKGLIMSRSVPGPHIAFYIPASKWSEALAHLENLSIPNGDRGAAKERVPGGNAGTYMDDPAGYVIQYITDGME